MRRYDWVGWLVVASFGALSGCDPHAGAPPVSGSLEKAHVKGVVRIRDKPVNNGSLFFECRNIRRPSVSPPEAKIKKDGSYEVETYIGENYVEVSCNELSLPKNRPLREIQLLIHVQPGENVIDVDLPEKATPLPPTK
jgi:hypothetical protein